MIFHTTLCKNYVATHSEENIINILFKVFVLPFFVINFVSVSDTSRCHSLTSTT